MKAVCLVNKGSLNYVDVPTPEPGKSQVLLRVKAVSICGSDVLRYAKGHRMYPLVMGHECAGVVEAVGEGVSAELIGRRAALIPLVPCFECPQCQAGRYSACCQYSFIGSRQPGGMAEYVEVPQRNLLFLPADLPFETAALIEPSSVARHILDLGHFQAGQSAAVLGAGAIGLLLVQWLHILGASQIVASDVVDENLAAAREMGADVTLNPRRDDIAARVKERTGMGVDLTLEMAGVPQTLAQTITVTRPKGWVVCGGNQPADASLPMRFIEDLMRKELNLVGCFMSYSAPFPGHEWTDSLDAVLDRRLDLPAMISHRFPLREAPQVFAEITREQTARRKIILEP